MAARAIEIGTTRSLVVTVRLDPRLKYLADLAARKQRRTLSSFIEWAIEQSLSQVRLGESDLNGPGESVSDADKQHHLWDVDDADRFAKLALFYPDLLTHGEQILWKLVRECGYLWRGKYTGSDNEWTWTIKESGLILERLRENWLTFQDVAMGDKPTSSLPSWKKNKIAATDTGGWDTDTDDIPF